MIKLRSPAICRSKWFTPLLCLGLGVLVCHNGDPYDWLLATGGLAYLVSFVFFRWRG